MHKAVQRLDALAARLQPVGVMVKAWETLPDGRAVMGWSGAEYRQEEGEELTAFLGRVAALIPRRPLMWASPQDVAL